jgi:hypothetical protein
MTENTIRPWESFSTQELANEFSEYHKAVHNFRPRYVDFDNREELLHQLKRLDETMEHMKSTPSGREYLRSEGWLV